METTPVDIQHKRFRSTWMGYDKRQVESFLRQVTDEVQEARSENADLLKELQHQEKELKEHKERERTIRAVLLSAHKTAEQMKANAEKEAKLIVAEAELKAEKVLQEAHQKLAQLQENIIELKRQRILMETKLRSTIESYRQLLVVSKDDEEDGPLDDEVKVADQ